MLRGILLGDDKIYRGFAVTEFFHINTRIETENLFELRVDERIQP